MRMIPQEGIEFRGQVAFKKILDTNQIFLYKLFSRIKRGYTQLVVICGQQRVGKSFVGIYLSYMFMELQKKEYDPTDHTFYDPIKSIESLGKRNKEPILVDEAGSLLTKREWYKKTHIALDKMIQTQGYKTMLYIFISPFTSDIDKTFLKHFDFQLRVDDRGHYKAFQIFKKYDEFKEEKAIKRLFLNDVKIRLKEVPKEIWDKYLDYSMMQKEKMRKDTVISHENEKKKAPKDYWAKLKQELGIDG